MATRPKTSCVVIGFVVVGLAGGVAFGQIDGRVNTGNANTAGRALDKNAQVGSAGYNLTRPTMANPGANANAIISGNVTGLAGFKAYSPIVSSNQFRAELPSSSLSGFTARSVGFGDVRAGETLAPTFYFGQTETISDAGYIRQGLNQPGSSVLRSTDLAPPSPAAAPVTSDLDQRITEQAEARLNRATQTLASDASRAGRTPITTGLSPLMSNRDSFDSAMSSSIFGAAPPRPRSLVPDSSALRFSVPGSKVADSGSMLPAEEQSLAQMDRTQPNRAVGPDGSVPTPSDLAAANVDREGAANLPGEINKPPRLNPPTHQRAEPVQAMPLKLGDDRFADLYSAVNQMQEAGIRRLGFMAGSEGALPTPPGAAQAPAAATELEGPAEAALRRSVEAANELAASARWAQRVLQEPVTSFVGKNADRLNRYLAQGEAALHAGEYYNAARMFELANVVDPVNPLPLLARGHALLAAGDFTSAVRSILSGIERFPQIASFRLDLPSLVGQKDVFDLRRAQLTELLAQRDNMELRFLLGYIELYSDLPAAAMRDLRGAAKLAPEGSIIALFPDLVTGLRELPPLK